MNSSPRWMKAALTVMLLALLFGGGWFYRVQEQTMRQEKATDLSAVVRLKAQQIKAWREDRLGDAAVLQKNPLFVREVARFQADQRDENTMELRALFHSLSKHYSYADVLLVDADGLARLSLSGQTEVHSGYASALAAALRERKPVFLDLYTEAQNPTPRISVIAPLFTGDEQAPKPVGAVILVCDASQFLYPAVQSWPTPTKSAETLLVRRDGDDVLFLNNLRYQPDTALKLRIPLSRTDVPAVMAVLGREGVVMGKDYRGVEVLSAILPVPDSPWYMVAKMDAVEAFAEWRFRSVLILALLMDLVGMMVLLGLVVRQQERKNHYRELYRSEFALRANVERHSITLKAIGDAVIATDARGRVELLNPVAEMLTGWSDEEARGRPLEEVFRIVNEQTRAEVENPVARVLTEGVLMGLANHTLLIARDGAERPVADCGAPIRADDGTLIGVVLVFRDQSAERRAQRLTQVRLDMMEYAAAHTLDELLTKALDEIGAFLDSPIGFYHFLESDQKTLSMQQWSTRTLKEFCRAEGKGLHYSIDQAGVWVDCVQERKPVIHNDYRSLEHKKGMPEAHAEVVRELVAPVMRGGKVVAILGVGNKPVDYTEKDAETVSYLADVTWEIVERRRAAEALQDSEKRYRRLFESAKDGIMILDAESGQVVDANPFIMGLLGYSYQALCGMHIWDIGCFKDITATKAAFKTLQENEYIRFKDLPLVTPDGQRIDVEFVSNVYQLDRTKVIQCNIRDITERKQAEEALRASEQQMAAIMAFLPDATFAVNSEGIVIAWNHAIEEMTGVPKESMIGKGNLEYSLPFYGNRRPLLIDLVFASEEEIRRYYGQFSRIGDAIVAETFVPGTYGGKGAYLWGISTPLYDKSGKVIAAIESFRDTTEHAKQAREIERLNRLYSVLSRVSQAVVRATSPEKFLEQACREIVEGGGFLLSWIGHVELITNAVVPTAFWGGISEYVRGITVYADNRPKGHGPTGTCIRERHPVVYNDFLHDPQTLPWHDRAAPFGIAAAAAFPIERAGGVWGALTIYSDEVDRFGHEDVKLLEKVAGDIGFALDNLDKEFRRRQAEDSLRESEEQFRTLVESAPDAIFIQMEGRFAYVNDAAIRLYGVASEEELLGHDVVERIHPDHRAKVLERLRSINEEWKSAPLMEQKHLKLDGTTIYVEANSAPIRYHTSESALMFVRDITQRKAAEQALRDSEERLKLALAAARMGVWEWDVTTNSVFWSSECYNIFGVKSFGGKFESFTDLVHPEDRDRVRLRFEQAVQERTIYKDEFRIIQPGGKVRWISGVGQTEYDADGQPLRLIGHALDISQRKQAEEEHVRIEAQFRQAQKMEALGTLAGGIAHDFNNILGIIMGFTELAKLESDEGHPVRDNLDEVLRAANRAKELVKQILAFSRMTEQHKMPLQLGLIVKDALKILRPSLPSTIEIKTDVLSKAAVLADPSQMHQVLMNLCTNAAHAMQDQGGVLEVRLTDVLVEDESIPSQAGLKPGFYVELTVRDTGCGIDPATIGSIFDPFFTTKKQGEGTGLGLSVVHGIVENHEGKIDVESEPGKGARFTVLIPALMSAYIPKNAPAQALLPRGQERVLVVDDEPKLVWIVKQMLKNLGYDVVSRTSGTAALEVLCHQPLEKRFDLVITDMTMPHLTGADLASELRGFQPVIPVILMTGFSKDMDEEKAKSLGIQGFLMKPIALEQLSKTVREVLDLRVK